METRAAKRREKDDDDDDDDDVGLGSDRISRLPDLVLHHILCFLSQKKAVQTSVLSKSWRHLGPTRPVIHLRRSCDNNDGHATGINGVCENCFDENKQAFLSVLENTFQRYQDQNILAQEVCLEMLRAESQSISVLEKWIPIFISPDNPALTKFHLSFGSKPSNFDMLSAVFQAESLRDLHLYQCGLGQVYSNSIGSVMLKNLQKLSLERVLINNKALEKILSGCPLLKHVFLSRCYGLDTINIANKNHQYLNSLEVSYCYGDSNGPSPSIEIDDSPTLQSIHICRSSTWNRNNYFPRLKSLYLSQVKLSTESFENFSRNFPRLEELTFLNCSGFEEINLSSCSIKHLTIQSWSSIKVAIEVPNILYFEFRCTVLPTLSLTTTSRKWKSHLNLFGCWDAHGKLFEMVKALSQSQISLTLSKAYCEKINHIEWDFNHRPAVVEHLHLNIREPCPDSLTHYLNYYFCILRPRYTNAIPVCAYSKYDEEVTEALWETLIHDREKTEYGWEQHLEEVIIEASDEKGKVWHHVQWTCLPEWPRNQKIRFRLKWKD